MTLSFSDSFLWYSPPELLRSASQWNVSSVSLTESLYWKLCHGPELQASGVHGKSVCVIPTHLCICICWLLLTLSLMQGWDAVQQRRFQDSMTQSASTQQRPAAGLGAGHLCPGTRFCAGWAQAFAHGQHFHRNFAWGQIWRYHVISIWNENRIQLWMHTEIGRKSCSGSAVITWPICSVTHNLPA